MFTGNIFLGSAKIETLIVGSKSSITSKKSKEKVVEKRCCSSPFREGVPLLVAMAVEEEADVVLVVLWPGRAEEEEEEGVVGIAVGRLICLLLCGVWWQKG